MKSRKDCKCSCHEAFMTVAHIAPCCREDDFENMCEDEFDRGLDRVWVCSLPVDGHTKHQAYAWHNINGEKQAEWFYGVLLGYRVAFGEWVEL